MPNYRRHRVPGGTYFFTVNLLERRNRPFYVDAWVVLPDHMHCIWTLPEGDADYASRWKAIKTAFSKSIPKSEFRSPVRVANDERGIWQRRYWEHTVRDARDYAAHMDYVHVNPVKHGLVSCVADWPFSSFHRLVKDGVYPVDWAGNGDVEIATGERSGG